MKIALRRAQIELVSPVKAVRSATECTSTSPFVWTGPTSMSRVFPRSTHHASWA